MRDKSFIARYIAMGDRNFFTPGYKPPTANNAPPRPKRKRKRGEFERGSARRYVCKDNACSCGEVFTQWYQFYTHTRALGEGDKKQRTLMSYAIVPNSNVSPQRQVSSPISANGSNLFLYILIPRMYILINELYTFNSLLYIIQL